MDVDMKKLTTLQNEKGMATIETVPLLLVFVILLAYSFGSFGVIHTGILNSIAARTYAFETFRNRANVTYFRDSGGDNSSVVARRHFRRIGNRIHGIQQETRPGDPAPSDASFKSTERPLRVGFGGIPVDASRNTASIHNEQVFSGVLEQRQTQVGVSPVWVMTQYGICINAQCGGN
jgi:hypothetical protein